MKKRYEVRIVNPVDGGLDVLAYDDIHVACMVFANYVALHYSVRVVDTERNKTLATTRVDSE